MIQQMADQYKGMMGGWNGWLVIRTIHHHAKDLHVPPGGDVALTEMGVLVNWPGDRPDGMFLPWTEIISMEQEHEDDARQAREAREHAAAEDQDGSAEVGADDDHAGDSGNGNGAGRRRAGAGRAVTA